MRTARDHKLAPSKYLRLPVARWGETDFLLTDTLALYEQLICSCGCGQYMVEAHDPDSDGWWEVRDDTVCYAGAALARYREENPKLEPGTLLRVVRTGSDAERALG